MSMDRTGGKYLQLSEVAETLAVSADTVRAWIKKGELKATDVSLTRGSQKPRLRVLKEDLDTFLTLRMVAVKTQRRGPVKSPEIPQIV